MTFFNRLYQDEKNSEFFKNVMTLLTGTGLSQLIPIMSSVILARIYSPEEFGVFSLFISIVTVMGSIGSLRYEVSIILPSKEIEAWHLFLLSLFIIVLFFIVNTITILVFHQSISSLVDRRVGDSSWLFYIAIGIFLISFYQVIFTMANRKKRYKLISTSKVLQTGSASLTNILLGILGVGSKGMILGSLTGQLLSSSLLGSALLRKESITKFYQKDKILGIAKKYSEFPKFSAPGTLFNSMANVGLPVLIAYFYGPSMAGLYFFSYRTVRLPFDLMFTSFAQVYRESAARIYETDKKKLLSFTINIQKKIMVLLLPSLILVSFLSPFLFEFVFGEEWYEAGKLVAYFAIFILFNGLYSPISAIGDILREQKILLVFNIVLSLSQMIVLWMLSDLIEFELVILIVSVVCGLYYVLIDTYMKRGLLKRIQYEEAF